MAQMQNSKTCSETEFGIACRFTGGRVEGLGSRDPLHGVLGFRGFRFRRLMAKMVFFSKRVRGSEQQ